MRVNNMTYEDFIKLVIKGYKATTKAIHPEWDWTSAEKSRKNLRSIDMIENYAEQCSVEQQSDWTYENIISILCNEFCIDPETGDLKEDNVTFVPFGMFDNERRV